MHGGSQEPLQASSNTPLAVLPTLGQEKGSTYPCHTQARFITYYFTKGEN